jgi:pimeloyl-ACP methyl ester carboxylesterase
MSGLAIFPLTNSSGAAAAPTIEPGNRVLYVYGRGTRVASGPSQEWTDEVSSLSSSPEVLLSILVTALTGCVVALPDFMGYGDSLGSTYRSYIVNKSYQTSTVPLVFRAAEILREETGTSTRLSNAAVVAGYSEGGYAAVSVAAALEEVGMEVLATHAGGAPLAISSTQLMRTAERISNGSFPVENYFFASLLGSAYSSTNPDVLNYGTGHDMLSELYRNETVQMVNSASITAETLNTYIYDLPGEDPMALYDPAYVNWTQTALALGETDPCRSTDPLLSSNARKPVELCAALQNNDLTETVLNATFPIRLCHSPDDVLVDFGNVPNVSLNDNLDLMVASGSHLEAGGTCLVQVVLWFLGPNFTNFDADAAPTFGAGDQGGSPAHSPSRPFTSQPAPSPPSPSPPTQQSTSSATSYRSLSRFTSSCRLSGLVAVLVSLTL